MPVFSIVMPTYNRLRMLREAVDSVRAQTFGDWELVVADDGSDAETAAYLEALARADPRVRVLSLPHTANLPRLRNQAIAAARGEWIAFLDSDDAWRADKLEKHLAAHRAHPTIRWSYSGRSIMDADGETIPDSRYGPWVPHSGWIARALLAREAMIAFPSVVVERGLLDEAGWMDETLVFSTDFDLELRLAARAECICLPEPLVRVRSHPSTTSGRPEVDESFIRVFAKFAAANPAPDVRAICRRQQFYHGRRGAWRRIAARDWVRAARVVAFCFRIAPAATIAWLAAGAGRRLARLVRLR